VNINISRLQQRIDDLAGLSDNTGAGVTRVIFSDADMQARAVMKKLASNLDLLVREDAVGNLFMRWEGSEPDRKSVATGSHIDAIPHAGKFDGVVGVLGALEAVNSLQEDGYRPKRSIEVISFTSEEPTRFGIGCLGSRILSGSLSAPSASALKDDDGVTLGEWLQRRGFAENTLDSARLVNGVYDAFVELHIEQGPRLEAEDLDIGIVDRIAGPSTTRVVLKGAGGHAGAVMMSERNDTLAAAGEIILAAERVARESESPHTVATVGKLNNFPNAVNSIPREVLLEIDLRDTDPDSWRGALESLNGEIQEISSRRGVDCILHRINEDPPAICDPDLVMQISELSTALGYSHKIIPSHAYHDSLFMAQICPTTMIFIPSRDGISHTPEEYSTPEQIQKGVAMLAGILRARSE